MTSAHRSVRKGLVLLVALLFAATLQAQTAEFRLDPTSSIVRFGDTVTIVGSVDNPNLETLAGYQLFYGFDADHFDLLDAPYLLPVSHMTSFYSWNAPPPVGTGWSTCPDTSDGVGHDYLGALGLHLPPYPPPQASYLLYGADFEAGQSSGSAPLDFVISEFASCAPDTVLSDDQASSVPVNFVDGAVEIVPNVGINGTVAVGQTFNLEIHGLPGNPFTIVLGTGSSSVPLGGKGTLYIEVFDPTKPWMFLFSGVVGGVGIFDLPLAIPPNPIFAGLDVHFQVLTGAGGSARLSNLASATVQ